MFSLRKKSNQIFSLLYGAINYKMAIKIHDNLNYEKYYRQS